MKLSQLKELLDSQQFSSLKGGIDIEKYAELLLNPLPSNFYYELEMTNAYIDIHEDISYSKDQLSLHSHTFYEILFCRGGNLQYLIGDTRFQLQKNDIVFLPPGISHRPLFLEELTEPYQRIVMWVNADFFEQCKTELQLTDFIHTSLTPTHHQYVMRTTGSLFNQIEQLFEAILSEKTHQRPGNDFLCKGLFLQLFCLFYRVSLNQTESLYPKPEKKILLDEIMDYIETHLADNISLKSISSEFLISQSSISQLFKKYMDVSFYKLVTQRRLIEAKNRILSGTSLKEIPELCGFSDYSVFYKAFIKEYGISPKEFKLREMNH